MKLAFAIFGGSVLFFLILHYVSSIKCFNCNSFYQQDCADYFDNQTVNTVDCNSRLNSNVTFCRKIIQQTFYEGQYHYRYIRQCAANAPEKLKDKPGSVCYERSGLYKVTVRYCHCNDQEGCNSGLTVSYSRVTLALLLLHTVLQYAVYS